MIRISFIDIFLKKSSEMLPLRPEVETGAETAWQSPS